MGEPVQRPRETASGRHGLCGAPLSGEIFGWMNTVGGFRRTRFRGLERTSLAGYLVVTRSHRPCFSSLPGALLVAAFLSFAGQHQLVGEDVGHAYGRRRHYPMLCKDVDRAPESWELKPPPKAPGMGL